MTLTIFTKDSILDVCSRSEYSTENDKNEWIMYTIQTTVDNENRADEKTIKD